MSKFVVLDDVEWTASYESVETLTALFLATVVNLLLLVFVCRYEIPLSDYDLALGVWNPTNVLITGEWVGLTFDLVILRLNFLTMMFWCGFFPHAALRCRRCRRKHCCPKAQKRSKCLRICCSTQHIDYDGDSPKADANSDNNNTSLKDVELAELGAILGDDQLPIAQNQSFIDAAIAAANIDADATDTASEAKDGSMEEPHDDIDIIRAERELSRSIADFEQAELLTTDDINDLLDNCMGSTQHKTMREVQDEIKEKLGRPLRLKERLLLESRLEQLTTEAQSPSVMPTLTRTPSADPVIAASMELLAKVPTVTNIRGFRGDELLSIATLQELHLCAGSISYLKVVSHATSVLIFTIFFPLLVPIVCIGLLVDMVAEVVGMLGMSRYVGVVSSLKVLFLIKSWF